LRAVEGDFAENAKDAVESAIAMSPFAKGLFVPLLPILEAMASRTVPESAAETADDGGDA
jgi:hypothetical protein